MVQSTGVYPSARVDAAGRGVVSSAGGVLLTETVRICGLGRVLSQELSPWRSSAATHDPAKVLTDLAIALALGGGCLADVALLRAEPSVFGPVASDPTVSRTVDRLAADAGKVLAAVARATAAPRSRVWSMARKQAPDEAVSVDDPLVIFEDEAGQTLRPPRARTWGHRGQTPLVRVCGKGSGRVSMAALVCYRLGCRPRLFYQLVAHHGRKGERRSMSETDCATLLTRAHQQLRAPLILVWDNLNTHHSAAMTTFLDAHTDWLTVVRLPPPTSTRPRGCGPTSSATWATSSAAPSTSSPPPAEPSSRGCSTAPTSSPASSARPASASNLNPHNPSHSISVSGIMHLPEPPSRQLLSQEEITWRPARQRQPLSGCRLAGSGAPKAPAEPVITSTRPVIGDRSWVPGSTVEG